MNVPRDALGDLLRNFYGLYGVADEGPPLDLDVSALLGTLSSGDAIVLKSDLDLLNRTVTDANLVTLVRECDNLLEEIANEAGQALLLEEIDQHYEDMSLEPDAVFHGILWYAQACHADPRDSDEANHFTPLRSAVDAGASPLWALGQQVTGAAILRLYVALVYLRGDWVRQAIRRARLDSAPSLLRYARLLEHDVIRHLRNSLSHGQFKPTCAGLHVKDRDFEVVLTPGILNKMCIWIFLLHYSIFMVYARREGITRHNSAENRRVRFAISGRGSKRRVEKSRESLPRLGDGRGEVCEGRFVPTAGRMILPGETPPTSRAGTELRVAYV